MESSQRPGAQDPQKAETRLVTAGRDTKAQKGFVNPPVVHGSTVLYPTAEDLHAHRGEFQYGRHGTPTTKAFQEALMALEGPQGRRPSAGYRQYLPAIAQFLQWPAEALRRRNHLFRSPARRWRRKIVQA